MPWIQMAALIETPHYSVTQSLSQEPSALGQEGYRVSSQNMKKNVCLFVCNWSDRIFCFCTLAGSQWLSYAMNTNASINWNPSLFSHSVTKSSALGLDRLPGFKLKSYLLLWVLTWNHMIASNCIIHVHIDGINGSRSTLRFYRKRMIDT